MPTLIFLEFGKNIYLIRLNPSEYKICPTFKKCLSIICLFVQSVNTGYPRVKAEVGLCRYHAYDLFQP